MKETNWNITAEYFDILLSLQVSCTTLEEDFFFFFFSKKVNFILGNSNHRELLL